MDGTCDPTRTRSPTHEHILRPRRSADATWPLRWSTGRGPGEGSGLDRSLGDKVVNPPSEAIVLCMDEKSSVQALDRIQPSSPMAKGRVATMT